MNSSTYKFLLDLHSTQSQIALPVTKGDTARVFLIRLADGGVPYVIEDGVLARLEIKRPTGTHISHFCAVESNRTVKYDFAQNINTAAVEGVHDCEVILENAEGARIASARFSMVVSDRVVNNDDIVLTDEDVTAVDAMLAEEIKRQAAETERRANETVREANEADRIEAEVWRKTETDKLIVIEQERQTNEARRLTAEKERASAELGRSTAEAVRAEAENQRASTEQIRAEAEAQRAVSEQNREAENSRRQSELESALARVEGLEGRIGEALDLYIDEVNELIGGEDE